ncbi:D-2-hydroxyacid dehydrogenase [Nesterenkonia sp. HG001]|uniref:D-2-hydroxyacid dehydrogenase n=1 Tax=Nesterenkonia sp. HG001 TaxID=2983207 RepID=UPI002AC6574F|nr:D-2-hydroxyacid dehydrogenase [Nesterenkonia sp. HG001]MDZ5077646.1 D-2-hydroxyacid dehydrogenase [Nesterenkonia sp. HG001]
MADSLPVITVLCPDDDGPYAVPPGLDELEDRAEIRRTTAAELSEALPGADILFLWDFFSRAVSDAWHAADALDWIHVAAAGVDKLLFDELAESEVTVTNAQGTFDRPIAEYVLGAVLARAKDMPGSLRRQQTRTWEHRETQRVQGLTALVIGTGAIGREIATLLRAVDVEVFAAGRTARDQDPDFGTVIASDDLPAHIGAADVVVNAAPLTPQTTGLLDAQALAAVKDGAHLINIGRGETVDEVALVEALDHGPLGFATLDVFDQEPLPQGSPLWEREDVLITAHMSGDVIGWRDALAEQFLDNARRWLAGETLHNIVDKQKGYVPRPQP